MADRMIYGHAVGAVCSWGRLVAMCANSGDGGAAERQHELSVKTTSSAQLPTI